MKAMIVKAPGGVDQLEWTDVPTPTAGPGEILVKVLAVGMNRADILQRKGHYPPPSGASELLGLEVSGHIEALGEGVEGWQVGDPCVALLAGGGYAEYVVCPEGQVMTPPPGVDLVTAVGLVEVAATLISNLSELIDEGKVFLCHGGAGGIGTFAIQYGKVLGATVAVTAGSPEKLQVCRDLGADIALDYHEDWVEALKQATDGHGADVILDLIGAKYIEKNITALAKDGTIVVIGLQGGVKGEINLNSLLTKRGTLRATSLRYRPIEQKAAICRRVETEIWPLVADGHIKPLPGRRFPLMEAAKAHEHLDSGDNVGKIILTVEP